MKCHLVIAITLSSSLTFQSFAQSLSSSDQDKVKMEAIDRRIKNGDKNAIFEEANLNPDVVVPALALTARDKSTNPALAELAKETLTRINGVEDYLKNKIDLASKKRDAESAMERGKNIELLSFVRTNKAVRTIASYLFDDETPGYMDSDFGIPSNKVSAAVALDDMKIPGAPSTQFSDYGKHVSDWRIWWLKNRNKFGDANPYWAAQPNQSGAQ